MSKTVLILVNHEIVIYNFRKELVERLINEGYEVIISCPYGKNIDKLTALGAIHEDLTIDRRGINPVKDIRLFIHYKKLIKKYTPDVLLTYTIKPNIYGGLVSRATKTAIIANITGLGTAIEKKGLLQFITIRLYKCALKEADTIFYQNKQNKEFMINKGIKGKEYKLLSGSGVNVEYYRYLEYPPDSALHFIYVGRLMKAKGIDYYLELAKTLKPKYSNTFFHIVGDYEENYQSILNEYQRKNYIVYHGKVDNVKQFYEIAHAIVHPTFHEGMSNVLLEAASSGRPIIASNIPGCREIIDEGINGFTFEVKSQSSLTTIVEKFINLPYEYKKQMGYAGREKMIKEFSRENVVNKYIEAINKTMEDKK